MKAARHRAILQIIRERPVATQEELVCELAKLGIEATQATVSRDIRELRLVKVAAGAGYRYAEQPQGPAADAYGKARRAFTEFVLSIQRSRNLLVLKTTPGTANAVAACIDEISFPEVVATLAGDDVVLIIVTDPSDAPPSPAVETLTAELYRIWGREA